MRLVPVLLIVFAAAASAQEKRKVEPRIIVATGCLSGAALRATKVDTSGTYVDRFRLKGPKEQWKAFSKEHQGHEIEVTGTLQDPDQVMGVGSTKEIGKKTKIYAGARPRPNVPSAGVTDPLIEVTSFRYLKDTCRY
jgi:hypothetical protein